MPLYNLSAIGEHLGVILPLKLITETFEMEPTSTDRRANLFDDAAFAQIKKKLALHIRDIEGMPREHTPAKGRGANKPKPPPERVVDPDFPDEEEDEEL